MIAQCVFVVWQWKRRWGRDVLSRVTKVLCSAHPLKYSDILDLDKRIREFEILPEPAGNAAVDIVSAGPAVFLQKHVTTVFKSTSSSLPLRFLPFY